MSALTIFIGFEGNDMVMEISSLRDSLAAIGVFLNAATVTLEDLRDEAGDQEYITPDVYAFPLSYVAASDGIYRGTAKDTWPLVAGERYIATIRASSGPGLRGEWKLTFEYQLRKE